MDHQLSAPALDSALASHRPPWEIAILAMHRARGDQRPRHKPAKATAFGPEAHTLFLCPLSDGLQAHTFHSVWAEGPHSVFTFTE